MRFALTDDQVALRDTVRKLLAEHCPPTTVRAAWQGGGDAAVAELWGRLAELGVLGAAVGEDVGGLGLTEVDLVPLLQEIGYAAVPLPVAETAAVAAPLIAAAGDPTGVLAEILAGRARVALATGDRLVAYAGRADLVLVLDDGTARLVSTEGVHSVSTVDGSRVAGRLATVSDAPVVTTDAELVALAGERAMLATAAQLVGLGRRMLDMTVEYVRNRRQFGVPVGSFQAVKHHLTNALMRLEFAEPMVLAAGAAMARRADTLERDVSAAVVLAVEAGRFVARTALQCHGAIGYTVEYDLHLYAKRAWALAATCDLDAHLGRLGDALGLPEPVHGG